MPDQVLREQETKINQAIILIHPAMSQSPILRKGWTSTEQVEHHLGLL